LYLQLADTLPSKTIPSTKRRITSAKAKPVKSKKPRQLGAKKRLRPMDGDSDSPEILNNESVPVAPLPQKSSRDANVAKPSVKKVLIYFSVFHVLTSMYFFLGHQAQPNLSFF
jgi:hypothetical protein